MKTNTLVPSVKTLHIKHSLLSSGFKGNKSMAFGPGVYSQLKAFECLVVTVAYSTMASFSLTISFLSSDCSAAFGRLISLPAFVLFKPSARYLCLPACHQLAN